ncbi:hypothetical protein [Embleya sp. NPDC050493]|uniref:hypothetical protein n=1 Tax=Embleya sp. NPDC050493 TaxID=3363989 RepID=UPI003788EF9C
MYQITAHRLLVTVVDIVSAVARELPAAAPTPGRAARLTRARLRAVLKRAGRTRGIEEEVERLHAALWIPQMRQLPVLVEAMAVLP